MRLIERLFGTTEIKFAAVDGTMYKDVLEDYMVFFGASYAVRGDISCKGDPPIIKYQKWSSEQDVSMVAYVPVPFAELGDILEEQFAFDRSIDFVSRLPRKTDRERVAEAFSMDEDLFQQTFRFRKGNWLIMSHEALGIQGTPIPITVENAEERIRNFLNRTHGAYTLADLDMG
jgi:hypothetical protein